LDHGNRPHLQGLTFEEFIVEFRENYLDEDWEDVTHRELLNISQGLQTFWDFAVKLQAKNSLLASTDSHLDDDKLRHQMEACMDERLSRKCAAERTNKIADFKKWMTEVKRIDDALRADRKEFENIARQTREAGRRANVLGDPSRRHNSMPPMATPNTGASSPRTPRVVDDRPRTPRLTDAERKLIFDNEGCLKCRRFFAGHRSANCNNDFPDPTTYRTLTQADVDAAKTSSRTKGSRGSQCGLHF
jgi:hypothetical protein